MLVPATRNSVEGGWVTGAWLVRLCLHNRSTCPEYNTTVRYLRVARSGVGWRARWLAGRLAWFHHHGKGMPCMHV